MEPGSLNIGYLDPLGEVPLFTCFAEFLQSDVAKTTDGVIISSTHATHAEIGRGDELIGSIVIQYDSILHLQYIHQHDIMSNDVYWRCMMLS